ncbi:MAG: hypothetical protein WA753_00720 [Pseudolabrys sp.]
MLRYAVAMNSRKIAPFLIIASLVSPAAAQEVAIGTQRLPDNGALFLSAAAGYFKARASTLR